MQMLTHLHFLSSTKMREQKWLLFTRNFFCNPVSLPVMAEANTGRLVTEISCGVK